MNHYTVRVEERHYNYVLVEAESPQDAIERVADGEGAFCDSTDFVEMINKDNWVAEVEELGVGA